MKIYVKLIKPWGEYKAGDTVHFDERKGRSVIAAGKGAQVKAPKPPKKEPKKKKPEVETATVDLSVERVETAEVTPTKQPKPSARGRRGRK